MKEDSLISRIKSAASERFPMRLDGIHGLAHWTRVEENGFYLAKHSGADLLVVRLFAFLHDCCRESDGSDHEHGLRAARFAESLRKTLIKIDDDRFDLLHHACEYHEKGRVTEEPTVGTCWDSDRLDLGRVGIRPNPVLLSTERARNKTVINWGYQRSRGHKATLKS